jgi:TatD DNase family protein
MEWFDTHAHLSYDGLRESLPTWLQAAAAAGVTGMVTVGTDLASSRACLEIATQFPQVWAAVGIHPNETAGERPGDWDQIRQLVADPRVVAVGETGLDLYWDDSPLSVQQASFRRHLQLSIETGLPIIIHSRQCDAEILAALDEFRTAAPLRGVMHSFSGHLETALACVELGLCISFAGMLTYKNAAAIRAVAAEVPADRLLIETDSPFLAPVPHRGQRPNHPAWVVHTGRCLAALRDMSEPDLAELTTANARRLFAKAVG